MARVARSPESNPWVRAPAPAPIRRRADGRGDHRMRSLFLLGSLVAIAACAGAVQGDPPDSSFSPTARSAEDSIPPAAAPANTGGAASSTSGDVATTSPATAQPPEATTAASRDPVTQTRSGRFRAELLQDKEFRLVFGDLQRLKVVLDFHEYRWGVLKLMVGPD